MNNLNIHSTQPTFTHYRPDACVFLSIEEEEGGRRGGEEERRRGGEEERRRGGEEERRRGGEEERRRGGEEERRRGGEGLRSQLYTQIYTTCTTSNNEPDHDSTIRVTDGKRKGPTGEG